MPTLTADDRLVNFKGHESPEAEFRYRAFCFGASQRL
jgi:hypothetical protein